MSGTLTFGSLDPEVDLPLKDTIIIIIIGKYIYCIYLAMFNILQGNDVHGKKKTAAEVLRLSNVLNRQ